jgi:carboxypeptidase Q
VIIDSTILGTVPLTIYVLGCSIGTRELGIMVEVIEVNSLKEAASLGKKALGKIVFYNRPMDIPKR